MPTGARALVEDSCWRGQQVNKWTDTPYVLPAPQGMADPTIFEYTADVSIVACGSHSTANEAVCIGKREREYRDYTLTSLISCEVSP